MPEPRPSPEAQVVAIRATLIDTYGEDYAGEDVAAAIDLLFRHQAEHEANVQRLRQSKNEALERAEAQVAALQRELARLHEGEADDPGEPGTWPTPARWIRRWNDMTPERRLEIAGGAVDGMQVAAVCRAQEDHRGQIERLRAELAEAKRQFSTFRDEVLGNLSDAIRERNEAQAERDLLRETLAESDLGAQVLAQWEAIAAADADRDRLQAERDEIKRVTDPPADEEMPTDPAELREMWEFITRQARWQWHMAHKFGDQVERLRSELAERKANAEGICIDLEQWKARAQLAEAELSDLQERVQKLTATRIGDFRLVPATEILAALAAPEAPGAEREGCDDPDCSRTECLHLGTCWEDAMDPPETPGDAPESKEDVGCPQCRGRWQSPGSMCGACRTLYPAIGKPVRLPAPETTPDAPTTERVGLHEPDWLRARTPGEPPYPRATTTHELSALTGHRDTPSSEASSDAPTGGED